MDTGVEAEEVSAASETVVDSGTSDGTEQDTTDWKAIAENYKRAFTEKRDFIKGKKTQDADEDDESKPLTRKDIADIIAQSVAPLVTTSREDSLLSQRVIDPAKRVYVKQLLESRIVRTGTSDEDIANDIADAIAMADRKKTEQTIAELKRAADNKPHAPNAGSSMEKPAEQKQYKWTAEQARALEARAKTLGVDPERFKKDAWDNQKKTRVAG